MTPSSIVVWFNRAFRSVGLKGCSSHSGRRTFVTRAARLVHKAGGSLRDVQLLAGHRSIQTTQRYIDGDSDAQRKLVALDLSMARHDDNSASSDQRQKHPKIHDRTTALDHAIRVIYRVCCLAGSANLIDKIRADLAAEGIRAAIRKRDTAAVFDWLIAALSYQGISDQIAYDYMEQHGYVRWDDINQKLAHGATCPKLKSYWHFHGCGYNKLRRTCTEPDHICALSATDA